MLRGKFLEGSGRGRRLVFITQEVEDLSHSLLAPRKFVGPSREMETRHGNVEGVKQTLP